MATVTSRSPGLRGDTARQQDLPYVDVTLPPYSATGDGVTNDTAAVQAALNTGSQVFFPAGVYLVDELTVPYAYRGGVIQGAGFYHYSADRQTVIKARTIDQNSVFTMADGADNVSFRDLRIDGDEKATHCIDASFGAFLGLDTVGLYKSKVIGFKGRQGLGRFSKVYSSGHLAIGFEVYSDATLSDSEFTGGTEPLRIVCGGNRLTSIWANSGSVSCLTLAPLDTSTTHINTSIVSLYAGETGGGASEVPIVKIQGNASQNVQCVQMSNLHLVCAASPDKINNAIEIDKAVDVTIGVQSVLGNTAPTATRHLKHFVKASNVQTLNINGGIVSWVTKNPVVLGTACYNISINGVTFKEWATSVAAGTEGAAILNTDANNYGVIGNCSFDISGASTVPYFMEGGATTRFAMGSNLLRYSSASTWNPSSGTAMGGWQLLGSNPKLHGTLQGYGTFNPGSLDDGAGETTTLTVTGAALGDFVSVASAIDLQGITVTGWVSAANTVSVRFQNETGGTIDLASATLRARVQKL